VVALVVSSLGLQPCQARYEFPPDSPLVAEDQSRLIKAQKYLRSRKVQKAAPLIYATLDAANDIPKCLALAVFTEPYGYPMLKVRRDCVTKALSLASTREDFMQVALMARRYQMFELTREAIHKLLSTADSTDALYNLAQQCQEAALNDVAHMAMEKAYNQVGTTEEAIKYARDVSHLGMDDLVRRAMKDLIDDEDDPHELVVLLDELKPMQMRDLNRYLLKKALDKADSVEEYQEIYEAARRFHETDVFRIAEYRVKKMQLLNKIKRDEAEHEKKVSSWKERMRQEAEHRRRQQSRGSPYSPGRFVHSPTDDSNTQESGF